jgi:hypothetical protein
MVPFPYSPKCLVEVFSEVRALSLPLLALLSLPMLPLAVLLVPAGVRVVKAASLRTLEVACPLHQPREYPRHGTYQPTGAALTAPRRRPLTLIVAVVLANGLLELGIRPG